MAYKEAVIIPFSVFKQYEHLLERKDHNSYMHLNPNEKNYKLFQQNKLLSKQYSTTKITDDFSNADILNPRKKFILSVIKSDQKPYVKSIFEIVDKHPQELHWNRNLEVIIESEILLGSDISEIFKFLTKTSVITNKQDIPIGSLSVFNKLTQIGVPPAWIAYKDRPKRLRAEVKHTKQKVQKQERIQPETEDSETKSRGIIQRAKDKLELWKTPPKYQDSENAETPRSLLQKAQNTLELLKTPIKRAKSKIRPAREEEVSEEEEDAPKGLSNSWLSLN